MVVLIVYVLVLKLFVLFAPYVAQFSFAHRNVYHLRSYSITFARMFLHLFLGQLLQVCLNANLSILLSSSSTRSWSNLTPRIIASLRSVLHLALQVGLNNIYF